MTKQEAIKNAWAKLPKCEVDENGWTKKEVPYENFDFKDYDTQQLLGGALIRPKELKGIEKNNGWIKIESEKDLPNENDIYCHIYLNDRSIRLNGGFTRYSKETSYFYDNNGAGLIMSEVTHYQKIIKPLPPIY